MTVMDEVNGCVNTLQQALSINTAKHEAAFIQSLGSFRARVDAYRREGMTHTGEERTFLRQGAAIGNHSKGIHLQAVVVMEAQRFVLYDTRVELEATGLETLAATRMAAIENRHVIFLGHLVDGIEQRKEVLFRVDVLLAVCRQQNILALFKSKTLMDVAGLNLSKVVVQHLCHRRTRNVSTFLGQACVGQITAGVLTVGHVYIADDIHNATVGLLRQTFVLATVASLHVEDRDMQALGTDDAQATVGVAQNQDSIRLDLNHELVALGDDIAHGLAQVVAHGVHLDLGVGELQVLEEHTIEVVVVILSRMRQDGVEVLAAFVDHRGQADDLRARADDDEQLKLAIILELCHYVILFIVCAFL